MTKGKEATSALYPKADLPKYRFPTLSGCAPYWPMKHSAAPAPLLTDTCLAFTPVPGQRHRADGWSPET